MINKNFFKKVYLFCVLDRIYMLKYTCKSVEATELKQLIIFPLII